MPRYIVAIRIKGKLFFHTCEDADVMRNLLLQAEKEGYEAMFYRHGEIG